MTAMTHVNNQTLLSGGSMDNKWGKEFRRDGKKQIDRNIRWSIVEDNYTYVHLVRYPKGFEKRLAEVDKRNSSGIQKKNKIPND